MGKHKHIWEYYHGMLGYESYVCKICGTDIKDLKSKPKLTKYRVEVVKLHNNKYSVYLTEKSPHHSTSKTIKTFDDKEQAEKAKKRILKLSNKSKFKLLNKR